MCCFSWFIFVFWSTFNNQMLLDILPNFHFFLWHSSFWEFWNVHLQLINIKLTKVRLEKLRYTLRNGLSDIKHNVNIKVTVQELQS